MLLKIFIFYLSVYKLKNPSFEDYAESITKEHYLIFSFTIASAQQTFIYPNQGQSPEQQSRDEFECQQWAKNQTGVDPHQLAQQQTNAPETQKRQVDIQEYEKNLNAILILMREIGVYPVWVSTTPVDDDRHNTMVKEFQRHDKDVVEYNNTAKRIMGNHNVPVIDLYTFSKNLGKDIYCDHVHFKEEVRMLQAAFIAGRLFSFR